MPRLEPTHTDAPPCLSKCTPVLLRTYRLVGGEVPAPAPLDFPPAAADSHVPEQHLAIGRRRDKQVALAPRRSFLPTHLHKLAVPRHAYLHMAIDVGFNLLPHCKLSNILCGVEQLVSASMILSQVSNTGLQFRPTLSIPACSQTSKLRFHVHEQPVHHHKSNKAPSIGLRAAMVALDSP